MQASSVKAIEQSYQTARKELIAALYERNLTYGEFAKKSTDLFNRASLARSEAIDRVSQQMNDEAARNRLVRAQEAQANAAQMNAETNKQLEADYLIGLGANILNSTKQVAPTPAPRQNIRCTQQGFYTDCRSY